MGLLTHFNGVSGWNGDVKIWIFAYLQILKAPFEAYKTKPAQYWSKIMKLYQRWIEILIEYTFCATWYPLWLSFIHSFIHLRLGSIISRIKDRKRENDSWTLNIQIQDSFVALQWSKTDLHRHCERSPGRTCIHLIFHFNYELKLATATAATAATVMT